MLRDLQAAGGCRFGGGDQGRPEETKRQMVATTNPLVWHRCGSGGSWLVGGVKPGDRLGMSGIRRSHYIKMTNGDGRKCG